MVLLHSQGSTESKVSTGLPVLTLRFRDFFVAFDVNKTMCLKSEKRLPGAVSQPLFSFDISSEDHACKTFHSACKTSDRFSIAALSANTCYVVAHSGGCLPEYDWSY